MASNNENYDKELDDAIVGEDFTTLVKIIHRDRMELASLRKAIEFATGDVWRVLAAAKDCIRHYAKMKTGSLGGAGSADDICPIMFGTPKMAQETLKLL